MVGRAPRSAVGRGSEREPSPDRPCWRPRPNQHRDELARPRAYPSELVRASRQVRRGIVGRRDSFVPEARIHGLLARDDGGRMGDLGGEAEAQGRSGHALAGNREWRATDWVVLETPRLAAGSRRSVCDRRGKPRREDTGRRLPSLAMAATSARERQGRQGGFGVRAEHTAVRNEGVRGGGDTISGVSQGKPSKGVPHSGKRTQTE
jgi:hypothetical protein